MTQPAPDYGAYLCPGEMLECLVQLAPVATEFDLVGTLDSGRLAFQARDRIANSTQSEFTVVATDEFGQPLGAKVFKLIEK